MTTESDNTLGDDFHMAGGTVIGSKHANPGDFGSMNNQDAFSMLHKPDAIIGVVCDGCSGGAHAEVGAKLAAEMLPKIIYHHRNKLRHTKHRLSSDWIVAEDGFAIIENQLLANLTSVIQGLAWGEDEQGFEQAVIDYMLFTIVGFVILEDVTHTFYLGDGRIMVNEISVEIPDPPGNAPAYFGFKLTAPRHHSMDSLRLNIQSHNTMNIKSILVGSDGLDYLDRANKAGVTIKEKPEGQLVGETSQFLDDSFVSRHSSNITKRLNLIGQETVDGKRIKPGPLKDDTTLIVVKRKNQE